MNDRQFTHFIFILMALLVLWWFFHRGRSQASIADNSSPYSINDPELITYARDPSRFGPSTVDGTININADFRGLNQNYLPLFGFVGMAQGATYQ